MMDRDCLRNFRGHRDHGRKRRSHVPGSTETISAEAETAGQSEQQPESDSTEQQVADRRGTVAGKSVVERFGQIPGLCLASGYTAPRDLTDLTTLPFLYENMGTLYEPDHLL